MGFRFVFVCLLTGFLSSVSSLYSWRNMTLFEYKDWYTEHEIIHLEDDSHMNENEEHIPFSWYCAHPHLSSHPFFKQTLEGYSDFRENRMRALIDVLWEKSDNVTLVFVGDSLTGNRIRYLMWDIKRYYGELSGHNPTVEFERHATGVPGNNYKMHFVNTKTNQRIMLQEAHLTINEFNQTTGVYYGNAEAIVDHVNIIENRSALIMLTMGAWFNEEDKFLNQMSPVVKWLQSVAQRKYVKNKVVWFAAMPQHFQTPNGYYPGGGPGPNGNTPELQCRPIANDDPSRDWRNSLVRKYLHNITDQYIEIFDDREIYKPMYTHHASNCDCTHYCYHPIIQQPLYEHMIRWMKFFSTDLSVDKLPLSSSN